MKRLGMVSLIMALAGTPAFANPFRDSIIAQLTSQGFSEIRVSRTLLGRTRVVAVSDKLRREIIFNPATGEILRDYWRDTPTIRTVERRDDDDDNPNPGNSTARIVDPAVEDKGDDEEEPEKTGDPAVGLPLGGAGDTAITTTPSPEEDTPTEEPGSAAPDGSPSGEVGGSTSAGGDEGSTSDTDDNSEAGDEG